MLPGQDKMREGKQGIDGFGEKLHEGLSKNT